MTPEQRTAVYAAVPAISAVLVTFGVLAEEQAAVVSAAVLAIVAVLVAFVHRPTKTGPEVDDTYLDAEV